MKSYINKQQNIFNVFIIYIVLLSSTSCSPVNIKTGTYPIKSADEVGSRINNRWFKYTDNDTVIIFLHGIFSDSEKCWKSNSESPSEAPVYWPELVSTDSNFNDFSIYLSGYYTALDAGDYGLRNAADEVIRALQRQENGRKVLDKKNILFVTHSTGGIVARYVLERYLPYFEEKNVGLVLIASPSSGSEQANRLAWLAELYGNQLALQLQRGNETLQDIDTRFKDLVFQRRINITGIEAYENHFIIHSKYIPDKTRVVTAESAGRYFGAPKLLRGTNHFTSVKPTSRSHPAHELLIDFYQQEFLKILADSNEHVVTTFPKNNNRVIERKWMRTDANGNLYSSTFTHVSKDQYLKGTNPVKGTYSLSDRKGRIYKVDFTHEGEGCESNFNPNGGYSGQTVISGDGKSFEWSRKWKGRPCKETYTAFYEVKRDVCIANCD